MSKISDDLFFLVISQNFTKIFPVISANYLPRKFWRPFFQSFLPMSTFSFWTSFRMPHYPGCPGPFFTFYAFTLTFSTFTYAFFQKTLSLDAPRLDAPGPSHPPVARHCWQGLSLRSHWPGHLSIIPETQAKKPNDGCNREVLTFEVMRMVYAVAYQAKLLPGWWIEMLPYYIQQN